MRSLSIFTSFASYTSRFTAKARWKRGEDKRDRFDSTPRSLGVLCACAVSLLFFSLTANAQTGAITGRVVNEEGAGMPGVTVVLRPFVADRQAQGGSLNRTITDEDGDFKFTEVGRRVYSVSPLPVKGYVERPFPIGDRQGDGYWRAGANVTITMIKGGAITGRVTNAAGEPVIGIQVNAMMVRDAEGIPVRNPAIRARPTDDRGVYRIYGLQAGSYVVFTRDRRGGLYPTPYDLDAPVYHPSSTRETATEVTVASGGETGGVDIRYRSEPGRVVSGVVTGGAESSSPYAVSVTLTGVTNGAVFFPSNPVRLREGKAGFSIHGVADGEYEIIASRGGGDNEEALVSARRRIVVKGADVGNIELKLLPLGSITGRFALETAPAVCESKRKWSPQEALLSLHREAEQPGADYGRSRTVTNGLTEKGEFMVYNLEAGRYFLEPSLPDENWYVKAITAPAPSSASARGAAARQANVAGRGIALKSGEKISGVTVTIAEGAASVSGKAVPAKEGERLPPRVRVHLVPAETAAANDALRYAEAFARSDGSFLLTNVSPGKYWLVARAMPEDELSNGTPAPVARDAIERAKLRKEAEAMKTEIELKPCQRVTDQIVKQY
ncbi:MAG TPA: carboxypeptidase-like regulatory domain-containing protein [Blastocatellia bacterium]